MAAGKNEPARKRTTPRGAPAGSETARVNRLSAVLGGVLIFAALFWFGWLILNHQSANLSFRLPVINLPGQPTVRATVDPLLASGITLSNPAANQQAGLTAQQATLLANQLEPLAAAHAASVSSSYVIMTYKGGKNGANALNSVPAWLVHYTHVGMAGPDIGADPQARAGAHDCYLFLDAQSGQELLEVWA